MIVANFSHKSTWHRSSDVIGYSVENHIFKCNLVQSFIHFYFGALQVYQNAGDFCYQFAKLL